MANEVAVLFRSRSLATRGFWLATVLAGYAVLVFYPLSAGGTRLEFVALVGIGLLPFLLWFANDLKNGELVVRRDGVVLPKRTLQDLARGRIPLLKRDEILRIQVSIPGVGVSIETTDGSIVRLPSSRLAPWPMLEKALEVMAVRVEKPESTLD